ncbi:cupin domain-containing protein [Pseudomonas sp. 32.2.56]|uniref:cupin domain-containing protein n=1 Tax=Pseudomonas sp. 32.2.56 TaxID=2969303 RepID=UPI00214FCF7F|nr:cupin domain-containing protein [Pseudomonas sp. 32.2.56]MCR4507802.1 cupin domain-containing protein [Pseudomonas sp. 32.2.56]
MAGSHFSAPNHPGGKKFLVLDGVFSNEHGDYPAGSYVLNPIGSHHAPFSCEACTIFVKLMQFDEADDQPVVIDSTQAQWRPGLVSGLQVLRLHQHGTEHVALVRWAPGTYFNAHRHWGGEEILVFERTCQDEFGNYPAGSWLRSPHLSHTPFSEAGCLI